MVLIVGVWDLQVAPSNFVQVLVKHMSYDLQVPQR